MNSKIIYDSVVSRALGRTLEGYSEKHHIIPKALGGTNHPTNIVRLTAREHFLAHWLLYKMADNVNDKIKMGNAFHAMSMMSGARKLNGRNFEYSRKAKAFAQCNREISQETRDKLSKSHTNKIVSEATKVKQSESAKIRVSNNPDIHREVSIKGNKARNLTDLTECYKKVSIAQVDNKSNQVFYAKLTTMTDEEFSKWLTVKNCSEVYKSKVTKQRDNLLHKLVEVA